MKMGRLKRLLGKQYLTTHDRLELSEFRREIVQGLARELTSSSDTALKLDDDVQAEAAKVFLGRVSKDYDWKLPEWTRNRIYEKVANQFAEEHYAEIAAKIDVDTVIKAVTSKLAIDLAHKVSS